MCVWHLLFNLKFIYFSVEKVQCAQDEQIQRKRGRPLGWTKGNLLF